MNNQIKTNALISYFFLGWLFLLAWNNPNFAHEFIVKHSKKATKIHFGFLVTFILYNIFLSQHLYYNIPVIMVSVDKVINLWFFTFLTLAILKWAYEAHRGIEPKSSIWNNTNLDTKSVNYNLSWISENDKIIYITSLLPFLWIITSNNYENNITKSLAKIGTIFTFLILSYYVFSGFDSIFILLIFAYILFIAFIWVNIFINDKLIINNLINKIPSLWDIYLKLRTSFFYFFDFLSLIFGRKVKLDFASKHAQLLEKDEKSYEIFSSYFTDESLVLSKNLIFIPILNLIFIPTFLVSKKSKYLIAITQGLIISFLLIFIWFYFSYYSLYQLFLLFPIFIWIANIDKNPFKKIPIIYDIYAIFDKLSFWIFSKVKFLNEKKKEVKEVSYKL
ncbi:MAG: hypothetical protein ACD_49C00072G0003 [uncultured bacterium (gcode 4)]|uniref:Uncharacterized protein n=1 Tax=uncultured bacterium (gcode 4) TaxID=1234023 RepID=K2AW83_9BACT|nr:MAG: hypothetical protein ACD_49C00072G0003 [uncultured bacterium (gcode 4)]